MTDVHGSPTALGLEGIFKSYGSGAVLDNVSLAIRPGEFMALVGPSGCGKSTLLRIAAGLDELDQGCVTLNGRDVTDVRAADRDVAMVFQSYALYPHLTARQNIALPLVMRRLSSHERWPLVGRLLSRRKRVEIAREVGAVAESLQIDRLMDRKPSQLSGGQRQRVALGRAIVRQPKAFLMDEPLSNLDAALRVALRNEIVALHRRSGAATLYVTHDQEEALSMADRVAVMLGGRILQTGTPSEIYGEPAHVDVAKFIGVPQINLIEADVGADGVARALGAELARGIPGALGHKVRIGFRPESISLSDSPGPGSIAVRLERVEFLGAEALVHIFAQNGGKSLVARMPPAAAQGLNQDHPIHASIRPGATLAFDTTSGARLPLVPAAAAPGLTHAA